MFTTTLMEKCNDRLANNIPYKNFTLIFSFIFLDVSILSFP